MYGKKWTVAACVLLTAVVLASCGKKEDTSSGTEGPAVEAPEPDASSNTGDPESDSQEPAADGTTAEKGDTNGGDFALTGQKWEWIYWDGNKDGEEEQLSFEYVDNGDEAESFILVTLEVGGSSEAYIDRARRIVRIYDKEDEEGPYLLVEYNYENKLSEKADMECIVRLREGAVVVEDMKEIEEDE